MTKKQQQYQPLRDQGMTLQQIADEFQVSRQAVDNALKYKPRDGIRGRKKGVLVGRYQDQKYKPRGVCRWCGKDKSETEFSKRDERLCKECASTAVLKRKMQSQSDYELQQYIDKYQRLIKLAKQELKRRN